MLDLQKPAFTLTVGELVDIFSSQLALKTELKAEPSNVVNEPRFEYSSKAAAKRLGVSVVTFQDWKNRNLFTFTQIGRKCIYDIPLILSELGNKNQNRRTIKSSLK